MEKTESLSGVPGMLRPFKEYVTSLDLKEGDQIVFYGCPGTCTPFVELLCYAIRDTRTENVFIPLLAEEDAVVLTNRDKIGMQAAAKPSGLRPSLMVFMGGLAMPNVPVSPEDAATIVKSHGSKVAGICFMGMFTKAGWTGVINFDILIDATIDPVEVWKK